MTLYSASPKSELPRERLLAHRAHILTSPGRQATNELNTGGHQVDARRRLALERVSAS